MKQISLPQAVLLSLALTGNAAAVIPSLNATQITQAVKEANDMSIVDSGYVLGHYLIRAYNQDVFLPANSPEIDGVVLSTPYEHLRYEAYLAHLEKNPLTTEQASAFARQWNGKLTFRVYSHSPFAVEDEEEQWQLAYKTDHIKDDKDRANSYLDFFKNATLKIGNRTYTAKPVIDGPYRDSFTLASGEAETRNLGVVFYTFTVPNMPTTGAFTLSFKDSQGKPYAIQGNLKDHK